MDQEEINLQMFLQWATELGVSDTPLNDTSISSYTSACLGQSLSIGWFPDAGGRGLEAIRNLRRGELVLKVPNGALMTSMRIMEKDEKLAHAVKRKQCSLSSTQILTVLFLAEISKGRKSFWYPYLTQIPRSYDILATFGSLELKAFQVDEAISTAESAISKAKSDWDDAIALLKELQLKPQLVTLKAWLWASATISSRTMYIPWDSAGCLCPVGDFFNYAAPGEEGGEVNSVEDEKQGNTSRLTDGGYDESVSSYCFYARRNYEKGEQVLLSYGTYTNLELVEHYGFMLNDNPNDKVFLSLTHEIVGACSWPVDSMYIHHNGTPSFALLSTLRLWTTTPSLRKSIRYLIFSGSQISPENEKAVMRFIASKCDAMLREFPTTIEDDRQLLLAIETLDEVKRLPQAVAREMYDFLTSLGLKKDAELLVIPHSAARRLDKWKLAINWRVRYKVVLTDAISHCAQQFKMLSNLNS